MIRSAALVIAGVLFAGQTATAQTTSPDSEDGRYTFNRAGDGYLRLDGRTGQVSICSRRTVGWACRLVPDERAALEAEIGRLQGESAALKKELIAHNLPLPSTVKPEVAAPKPDEPRLQMPSDADLNKMMNLMEKVWRRLVEMIASLQKDFLNKS